MENKAKDFKYIQFEHNDCIAYQINGVRQQVLFRKDTEFWRCLMSHLVRYKPNALSDRILKKILKDLKQIYLFKAQEREPNTIRPIKSKI